MNELSIKASRAMCKANESVLYPTIAEDDAEAVRRCVPWLRERKIRIRLHELPDSVYILAFDVPGNYVNESSGETWAIALCRLVIAVAESEARP